MSSAKRKFIIVTDSRTGHIVERIDVSGKTDRQIEKTERGMLINMDRDNFYTAVVEE